MARCLQDVMLAMHWYFFGLFTRRAGAVLRQRAGPRNILYVYPLFLCI